VHLVVNTSDYNITPFKTKTIYVIQGLIAYRAVNIASVIKTELLMLYKAKVDSNKSTNKMHQIHVYYLTFMCGSTCLGRLSAHHQERTTALGASGFTVGAWRL
jgi:CRISPR/Cas system type I-B associated protein Csh2 (Cas7 group RAMP superfamily)